MLLEENRALHLKFDNKVCGPKRHFFKCFGELYGRRSLFYGNRFQSPIRDFQISSRGEITWVCDERLNSCS